MNWILLIIAGLLEVIWAVGLKYTDGFSRLFPTSLTIGAMIASIVLLGLSAKTLPIGTAYAVWVGIGTIGTAAIGIFLLSEPINLFRILGLSLILGGVVILKLSHVD